MVSLTASALGRPVDTPLPPAAATEPEELAQLLKRLLAHDGRKDDAKEFTAELNILEIELNRPPPLLLLPPPIAPPVRPPIGLLEPLDADGDSELFEFGTLYDCSVSNTRNSTNCKLFYRHWQFFVLLCSTMG